MRPLTLDSAYLDPATPGLPDEVREAAGLATAARDQHAANGTALSEARAALKAAPAADLEAELEAGNKKAKPSEPRLLTEVEKAERGAAASEELAYRALVNQAEVIAQCKPAWSEIQEQRLAAHATRATRLIGQLREALLEVETERNLLDSIEKTRGKPRSMDFRALDRTRLRKFAEIVARDRKRVGLQRHGVVERDRDELLAALVGLVTGPPPRSGVKSQAKDDRGFSDVEAEAVLVEYEAGLRV